MAKPEVTFGFCFNVDCDVISEHTLPSAGKYCLAQKSSHLLRHLLRSSCYGTMIKFNSRLVFIICSSCAGSLFFPPWGREAERDPGNEVDLLPYFGHLGSNQSTHYCNLHMYVLGTYVCRLI